MTYEKNQCGSCYWLRDYYVDTRLFEGSPCEKGHCIELGSFYYPDDSICRSYKDRDNYSYSPDNNCYITTIVCDRLGKEDACFELQTLRRFRKDVLQVDSKYSELLYEYDSIGPEIAKKLVDEDSDVVSKIFTSFIKPIVGLINSRNNEEAINRYITLTEYLEDYYGIEKKSDVPDNYDFSLGGHGKVLVKE